VKKLDAPIPCIALTPPEAAAALGCGERFFNENVARELRLIRRGAASDWVPVAELERWVAEKNEAPMIEHVA
jgi:hypothetical protein